MSLIALVAAMGAAIDVGRLAATRQGMQNAADLGATAGVSALPLGAEEVWHTSAQFYAANTHGTGDRAVSPQFLGALTDANFPGRTTGARYRVGEDVIAVRHPFRDAATDRDRLDPEKIVHVDASRLVQLPIAAVVGVKEATVAVRAGAVRRDAESHAFMFASASNRNDVGVDWSSQGAHVIGDIHSNSQIDISGFGQTVTGWVEYRYEYDVSGAGHTFEKGFRTANLLDLPLKYTPTDFEPYDYVFQNNAKFPNHAIPAGVYYVNGNLSIGGDDFSLGPVTFVVTGAINVSGAGHNMVAARHNVLFYSLSTSRKAIDVSAQGGQWRGYIFAPDGGISFSARGMESYEGGLVGDTIKLTGNDFLAEGTVPYLSRTESRLFR
jgi:hypothetical protein